MRSMLGDLNVWLLLAASLSGVAALLHVLIVFGGAPWYRFFGAGEHMARLSEARHWWPPLLTSGIAMVLGLWALYALAASGALSLQLPWPKLALCLITAIYCLRGLAILPLQALAPERVTPFLLWSSVVCLGYGIVHLIGLKQVWEHLQ
ncbi:hypothetical protein LNV23_03495 [Paucibacter sp. DJ1R-11]|uniref:hypothetical protein n=1 Tax=Paucibacter sp. DJ1R-11 TaxID=2893556 RepID=UPI0021E4035A|nr:hypothetical protein [Paucibacter sp. DJ1R-11]MCV2362511.1 hypothetical protein [Paucibacter sp. DJ1R-11]